MIRDVPSFLRRAAGGILNHVAGYLLDDAKTPLVAGDLVHLDE